MKRKLRKIPCHIFRFKIDNGKTLEFPAQVVRAKKAVDLVLTAEDVKESIRLKGVGNTQTCSMAVCAKRLKASFPHVVEGYIDWQYTRAYVVSKVNAQGIPVQCVAYAHSDKIAQINDSKAGQLKLLAMLEKTGPITIQLRPLPPRGDNNPHIRRPEGKSDGSRSKPKDSVLGHGAKRRFAVAQMGGI